MGRGRKAIQHLTKEILAYNFPKGRLEESKRDIIENGSKRERKQLIQERYNDILRANIYNHWTIIAWGKKRDGAKYTVKYERVK